MKVERKVAWTRGMLMLPQHLQQQERYHESLLNARLDALEPYAFGALKVALDPSALRAAEGRVSLLAFDGIMPDGTPLSIGSERGLSAPPPIAVTANALPASGRPLSVYLAIARERVGADNYGLSGDDHEGLRYGVDKTELADRAKNDRRDIVMLAAPITKLVLGEKAVSQEAYDSLKIAEIVHGATGLSYSESYIPPCLRISAAPGLVDRIQRLRGRMVERHIALTARRRETDEGRIEYSAVDVTRYLQLHAINGALPALHHLGSSGDVAPRLAFLMLTQVVGQLATFSTDVDMKQPFDFRFDDLQQSFERVLDLAEELLQLTDRQLYVSCPLVFADGVFRASLADPRLHGAQRYVLAIKSDLERQRLINEVEQNAKIATGVFMKQLRKAAFGGVPATAIRDDELDPSRKLPIQIERQRGWTYFNIPMPNQHTSSAARWEDYWRNIWQANEISLWLPEELTIGMELKLLRVLDGRGE
jgi:type VI secretion system protein ImpJ